MKPSLLHLFSFPKHQENKRKCIFNIKWIIGDTKKRHNRDADSHPLHKLVRIKNKKHRSRKEHSLIGNENKIEYLNDNRICGWHQKLWLPFNKSVFDLQNYHDTSTCQKNFFFPRVIGCATATFIIIMKHHLIKYPLSKKNCKRGEHKKPTDKLWRKENLDRDRLTYKVKNGWMDGWMKQFSKPLRHR